MTARQCKAQEACPVMPNLPAAAEEEAEEEAVEEAVEAAEEVADPLRRPACLLAASLS